MATKWEYLIVTYEQVARESEKEGVRWDFENAHYIWRPGDTFAEKRTEGKQGDSELAVEGASVVGWLALCNELGDEGWELVESQTMASAVISLAQGFHEVTTPLRIYYSFKRPVDRLDT
ncbi:hypothetical protein [Candidatus Poriferisocius sp.]|uniref:hypothetical protein n=1 Tax=Candidatus Poriferisocius sp. TaxID=3101276 RepID=UPI003B028FCC